MRLYFKKDARRPPFGKRGGREGREYLAVKAHAHTDCAAVAVRPVTAVADE